MRSTTAASAPRSRRELTHGFDDEGRSIDADGTLRDWWTPRPMPRHFRARAPQLGAQYAAFEPLPGLHVNPAADDGRERRRPRRRADCARRLSRLAAGPAGTGARRPDRRPAYSSSPTPQNWRGKVRDEAIREQTATTRTAFRKFRVLGPLPNVDDWYRAFKVRERRQDVYRPGRSRPPLVMVCKPVARATVL